MSKKGRKKPSNQTWWNESLEQQGDREREREESLEDFSPSSPLLLLLFHPWSNALIAFFLSIFSEEEIFQREREVSNLFYLSLFSLFPIPLLLMHFSRGHLLFSFFLSYPLSLAPFSPL